MSDDLSQAAEPAEAAQGAVEPNAPDDFGWDGPFDPDRAKQTITNLRGREKELEPKAKQFERLGSDEEAFLEFVQEKYPHLLAEQAAQDDLEDDFEDPEDPTDALRKQLGELQEWKQQQEAERGLAKFNTDLDGFAKDANVEITDLDREAILSATMNNGGNQKAAKAAFDRFVEHRKAQEKAAIERYLKSKTDGVPSPPQAGKAGKAEFDPTDRKARRARFEAIVAGQQ